MRTLEQLRAANALDRVNTLAAEDDGFKKSYRAYVERLGPGVVMNGLGQALATERAAAGGTQDAKTRAHAALYESVKAWLCRADGGVYPGADDLLQAIVSHEEPDYLRAQAEALAWLEWHKKFCRATFPRADREE